MSFTKLMMAVTTLGVVTLPISAHALISFSAAKSSERVVQTNGNTGNSSSQNKTDQNITSHHRRPGLPPPAQAPVPEPASLLLMLSGLAGFSVLRGKFKA